MTNATSEIRSPAPALRSNTPAMQLEGYTIGSFDRGAPRWKEALWHFVKALAFLPPTPLPSAIRVALLRFFGARIGEGVVIRSQVEISHPWRLTVGHHVWLGEEVRLLTLAPITLEDNVCLSQRAFLCTGSHAFNSPDFHLITKPIIIRARSWIAAQVFVAPGLTVGPDSMACAGAVLFADVPPGTVVIGNPAGPRTV